MMTANDIRKKFLEFFASKEHAVIESDSLVPKDDPTVLFTTAGMQQFKRQFLGHIDHYTRATTSQKCLRTDDLTEVGVTDFHHTFFEMLGNFSFGDYFKKEAITWAWEFLTQEMNIPAEKLWVSVYHEDVEAKTIWLEDIKIPQERLVALGDHSNFWPADAKQNGPNGPCGPCSEIFYDYGTNPDCSNSDCNPDCDCGRFSEVWNLVFTQFERKDAGVLEPLPNKNIDTGMGLERLVSVLQGKRNNFETDIFSPIIEAVEKVVGRDQGMMALKDQRVIADHMRAVVFSIADGVIPSNKERGYVVKGLINSCTNIAARYGHTNPVVYQIVPAVVETMEAQYPELQAKANEVAGMIQATEKAFLHVLHARIPELQEVVKEVVKAGITVETEKDLGEIYFKFHDTYGLPIEGVLQAASKVGITDAQNKKIMIHYEALMKVQQDQSRASSKMTGDVFTDEGLELGLPKTCFLGYQYAQSTSTVLKLFVNNNIVAEVTEGDEIKVVLDKSPFYAESGGQVGDTGVIFSDHGRIKVTDTQKVDDIFIHHGTVESGAFHNNSLVRTEIDLDRRLAVMRNHTATHLLQCALRNVLGAHVQQQGSLVDAERLRFDFTHHKAITSEELRKIEDVVNGYVRACDVVGKEALPIEEARQQGALAFFAEKYDDVVRVVSIGEYSKEFCGGTHLDSTGQISLFKIISESAIAQGIRRLEAKTGTGALAYVNEQEDQLRKVADMLKVSPQELVGRVKGQVDRVKTLERELTQARLEVLNASVAGIIEKMETVGSIPMVSHFFDQVDMGLLRQVSDRIKKKVPSGVIFLGARYQDNASLLVVVTDDLIKQGITANTLIQEVAPLIHGKGGGRPQLAQAGSKEGQQVQQVMTKAVDMLREAITA